MANQIEETELNSLTYVPSTSRYAGSKVIKYTENGFFTFPTYKKKTIPVTSQDKYWVITKGYEYRPDLASYELYGLVDFWWRLMEANGIMDIMDFKAGTNIRIPVKIFY